MMAGEGVGSFGTFHGEGGQTAAFHGDVRHLTLKADIRAQLQQLLPQIHQRDMQIVGAHMGLGVNENVLRCSTGYQLLQNEAVADILGSCVQLAVGESAGAALAELDVGALIQLAGGPEMFHVGLSVLDFSAPLQ